MSLTCNIDKRGRQVRLIGGVIVDVLGVLLVLGGILQGQAILLGAGLVACLGGSFMVFEGAAGWCALRAMGFKTRL